MEVQPGAVGCPLTAVTSLQVEPRNIGTVLDRLATHSSARMVSLVAGKAPVVFHGAFSGPQQLGNFLTKDIGALPGVQAMDTCVSHNILRRYWMDRDGLRIGD